ncbi:MAG: PAS domain S-box protein [Burkholderiaceae bacterium]
MSSSPPPHSDAARRPSPWWRRWWRRQSPGSQDRIAMLGPLAAVVLFLAAIVAAFTYLRTEELDREREAVKRDVEYAQQRVRLRLIERQEQVMRLARDAAAREIDLEEFINRSEGLVSAHPELQILSWLDARRTVRASYASPSTPGQRMRIPGRSLRIGDVEISFNLARDLQTPVYSQPAVGDDGTELLQLHVPLYDQGRFAGMLLAEYSIDNLLRYAVPPEVASRYAMSFVDANDQLLAGSDALRSASALGALQGQGLMHDSPVSPVGNGLVLRGQAYRASMGLVGSGLFWLVGALSVVTAWMLLGNWRHTRRRMQAQQALVAETNFRRAMENSMPTGMRALDLEGRITYVNAAFCQMTGWSESELVGRTAPFPYWPEEDRDMLAARLEDELRGRTVAGGFQVRVKRKDGSLFDARMYVSPLIDARGQQTGWMTSMNDITEPNRIREQLQASHERFTTVLEALDASVSVAPLGSTELLFANKLYRMWFGTNTAGHLELLVSAGEAGSLGGGTDASRRAARTSTAVAHGDVDAYAGLPLDPVTSAQAENAEIYVPRLDKWLEVRARYLNWVDGRLAQMVIATDITPRRNAEEQAAAQAERAQSASRLITMGEMASSVAHELNQPLTAINNYCTGMISRIRSRQIAEEDLLGALDKTARQAQRAGQIIQRIRSFVKRSEPNRTLSDVNAIVAEAVELAGFELRRRNVRLSHYVAARLPQLVVDPILIEQVLVNLLKNAAEAIDQAQRPLAQRSVELRVLPRQQESQTVVEFSVVDSGGGLAPEVMERLYEAFFSTKSEGMGIGLSLCRSIVESHMGRMQAENLYNGAAVVGCRFSFWLPLGDASALPSPPPVRGAGVSA